MPFKKKKIAIVGMACRLPGGIESPDDYWQVLKNGEDVVSSVDSSRWGTDFYQHPDKKEPGKSYTFNAGVLSQVDQFDAGFFGISPREAAQMDPQQRLLLELTWEALENGGQVPENLSGSKCAVYVGIASTDYAHRRMDDLCSLDPYSMTGNTASIASNRISYLFNLHGPSVSVDTACSSSLVALHQACSSIWSGDAPMAIAGGVNMLLHPFGFVGFSKASMLSPRGRCRAFDDSGDGYVRAEGSGVLFLKPLEDAITDGDPIQAVIVESGINSDGQTNGISLPSTEGQSALLQEVYSKAGIKLDDISYIEAHGTGTAVGDPIETAAISKVLAKPRKKPLRIGSAKTNLGHLETASGMAGIFKIIMSLKNRAIPESLHFDTPNKNIDFEKSNLKVVNKFTPLPKSVSPLFMGVNSFGFGGANAHVLLEEYQVGDTAELHSLQKPGIPPLFLSANSKPALEEMAAQYSELLDGIDPKNANSDYYDIAYSALNYRQRLKHGLAVNGNSTDEIKERLASFADGEQSEGVATTDLLRKVKSANTLKSAPKLALVFSGNGSQWQGMGNELLASEPIFRTTVEEINALLSTHSKEPISLIDEFQANEEQSRLEYTEIAQLLLFALQVGIIKVLRAHGLKAEATLGHSVGEVSAAWAAGALTLEQAVKVIYERSHAQGETKGTGRMAAAGLGDEAMLSLLEAMELQDAITIAGINSPNSVTLSGSLDNLEKLTAPLEKQGVFYRILDLDYAFHSPQMSPIEQRIKTTLTGLDPHPARLRFVSTVTGSDLEGERLDATYWWENIRQPVLFGKAMETLLDDGYEVFLEIGPHPILRSYINECSRAKEVNGLAIATQSRKTQSQSALLDGLYTSYLAGCPLDINYIFPKKGNFVQLPNYPWQRERHWYTLTSEGYDLVNRTREHPLLGYRIKSSAAQWENQIDFQKFPYLADHVVDGGVVYPAAAYVEMALAASASWHGSSEGSRHDSYELENLEIKAPIVLDNTKSTRFTLSPDDGSFTIESRDRLSDNPWTVNVVGRLLGVTHKKAPEKLDTTAIAKQAKLQITSAGHYQLTESVGLSYGPGFQGIADVWVAPLTALARLQIPKIISEDYHQYNLHPAMLDAGFQVLVDVFAEDIYNGTVAALIPVQIGKLYCYNQQHETDAEQKQEPAELAFLQVAIRKQSPQSVLADFYLTDADGNVLVELVNCRFKGVQFAHSRNIDPATYVFNPLLMPQQAQQASASQLARTNTEQHPGQLVKKALSYLESVEINLKRKRHYQQILPLFDVMISMFAWQAIRTLTNSSDLQSFSVDTLVEQEVIDVKQKPLLIRLLQILEADDLAVARIAKKGAKGANGVKEAKVAKDTKDTDETTEWSLVESTDFPDAEDVWLSILGDSPAYLPELILLGRCGANLADVLQGKQQAKTLLYPKKSSTQEHWYHTSQSYTPINLALRKVVTQVVANWPENRRIRILEIGGSDAGLTRELLPLLPAEQCDYLFTDTAEDAVSKAAMELETWEFLQTQVLDIESKIDDELLGGFDIVIAANVLYQADNLKQSLKHIHQLLATQGLLIIQERQPDAFTDCTLGLDPQWWSHSTEAEHPLSLLLSLNEWKNALGKSNFGQLSPLTEPEAIGEEGAFLLLATAEPIEQKAATLKESEQEIVAQVEETQSWTILVDQSGFSKELGEQLVNLLKDRHQQASLLEAGSSPLDAIDIESDHIIHLAGLDTQLSIDPLALQQQRCISTTDLVQAIEKQETSSQLIPKLWLITANAALVEKEAEDVETDTDKAQSTDIQPDQAALWGLGRVIMNEHPDLDCRLIDLQFSAGSNIENIADLLTKEFLDEQAEENEILLSEHARHVMRMQRISIQAQSKLDTDDSKNTQSMALSFKAPGPLKNLYWKALPKQQLADNEIEIQPYATGLNFRDVMYAMGMLSDEAVENGFAGPTLGMELSGKVINVGKNITEYQAGDKVIGFAPACFSTRVITETTAIAHMPDTWSYAEAATIPTTFFTVYYALHQLAQIREGEKILIHGAAGGVGIAAIQFARYRGAEIFATAGSEEKRDFVRLMGADHVLDSRSLAFADEIMEITAGEGVDIVLNSLAGEAINRNLSILKPFGRFLELGKRDFYENNKIGLRPFRNNISYFGIDADQLLIERADLAAELFQEMMGLFTEGVLRPLPHRVFPASQIEDAFRYMQQSRQIGKVIVSFEGDLPVAETKPQTMPVLTCDPGASYLVTGGLSGFGLKTAQWLVEKGAKKLVLASRRGKPDEDAEEIIKALHQQGIDVYLRACDVADKDSVDQLFAEFGKQLPQLKGIVHAAMVLDDGLLRNMSHEQFNNALTPKISGAWNLHQACAAVDLESELEFFVLYSSATTYLGNPGQANYVAANQYLEALASYRQSLGLKATYAAWGAIDDVGFLARNEDIKEALQSRLGGTPLSSSKALGMLEKLIVSGKTGAAVIDFDWNVIQRIMPGARSPKYIQQQRQVKHADSDHEDIQALIANKSPEEVQELIVNLLLTEIEQILRLPREKLDTNASVFDLGMDSLMGMELVLAIEERFSVRLPVMALTEGATITRIAERISSQLLTPTDAAVAEEATASKHEEAVAIAATRHAEEVDEGELEKISKALADENREGTNG